MKNPISKLRRYLGGGIVIGVAVLIICLVFGTALGLGSAAGLYGLVAAIFGFTGFVSLRLLTGTSNNNHSKNHQEKQVSKSKFK